MAINKVDLASGETLIDLTNDSATESVVFEGATFHGSDGETKTGTFTISSEITEQDSLIAQIKLALAGKAAGGGGEALPTQEKTVNITTNGTHEVLPDDGFTLSKVKANVNVPIPDGYIKPIGTLAITKNGEHDAKAYEKVAVNVPIPDGYLIPDGTLEIVENGSHNVAAYESVDVDVPIPDGYIVPSGTMNITANGSYDVTEKAGVVVAVPDREIVLQDIEVTENGTYSADAGFDGIGQVTVNVAASGGGGSIVEGIPDGYAKVDYIQFSGSESVDTGIICNQSTKIIVRYTRDSGSAMYLYGVVNEGNTASVTAYLSSGGSWRFGSKSISRTIGTDAEMVRTAIVQKSGIVSDAGTNTYSGVTNFEALDTLILGGCHYSSGSIGTGFVGKVLTFEIWQGSELALKLMPIVNAEGEYRFWDQVGQKFIDTVQGAPLGGGNL